MEQAAPGSDSPRRSHPPDARKVCRRVPPAFGTRAPVNAVRDQLERLVQELLDRGVRYDDARREFEKMFIARALQRTKGNLGIAADLLGLHRNTIARKMTEYRIKRTA